MVKSKESCPKERLPVHELGEHQLLAVNLDGYELNVGSCGGYAFAIIVSETSLLADPPRT